MLEIRRAKESDADDIREVQNRCFLADFKRYGACPGYQLEREHVLWVIHRNPVYLLLWEIFQ